MQKPPTIIYRNTDRSGVIDGVVYGQVEKLESICDQIIDRKVVIETMEVPGRDHPLVQVDVEISVPGKKETLTYKPRESHAHEDIFIALNDVFDDMQRQLQEYMQHTESKTRKSKALMTGVVCEIFPEMNYGKIMTSDGHEVYFHRDSVEGDTFTTLKPDSVVQFKEITGLLGRQASMVKINE